MPELATDNADVVLVGGGVMSATLASMLAVFQPDWRVVLLERAGTLATESSAPWNNAGTGHAGMCELNYMPDPTDERKAADIGHRFNMSTEWWGFLASMGQIDPHNFIHSAPHMDVVFGAGDVAYLRRRFETMRRHPLFVGMEYSEDAEVIRRWAPLVMDGRADNEAVAATRVVRGTDVDFGALTHAMVQMASARGTQTLLSHEVRTFEKESNGRWAVRGRRLTDGTDFNISTRHVFVGAGGFALRLLQKAKLPEVRGYAVLPVGAAFYRTSVLKVVSRHDAKVYGQADIGAPPMSVPHLDKRVIDGSEHLMFGPYATFSTKLLKNGKLTDFFTTLTWRNLHVIVAAAIQNTGLIRYLIKELLASPAAKFAQLTRYYPEAREQDWELIPAGQRAQLVKPDRRRIGALQQGTELVVSADHSMSGLLGASPGASTAVATMLDLLRRCFPEMWEQRWSARVAEVVPSYTTPPARRATLERRAQRVCESLDLPAYERQIV